MILTTSFFLASCQKSLTTKYLKEDELLLLRNRVILKGKSTIDKEEIATYIRQKPNKSYFGFWQIGLQWKNLWYKPDGDKPNPAVILDSSSVTRSESQLEIYLQQLGYYNANVTSEIKVKNWFKLKRFPTKKAVVKYIVNPESRTVIDSLVIDIKDSILNNYYIDQKDKSVLKLGVPLTVELLEEERTRITSHFRDIGYFDFSDNFIKFLVDTNIDVYNATVVLKIKNPVNDKHPRYKIRNVFVHNNFNPLNSKDIPDSLAFEKGLYFINDTSFGVKKEVLERSIFFKPQSWYSVSDYNDTYRQLANLQMYSGIKITYEKVQSDSSFLYLDVNVILESAKLKSISVEATATFREGFGGNGTVTYQRKNFFGIADIIEFNISGGVENLKSAADNERILGANIGPMVKFRFPGLMFFPKLTTQITQKSAPKSGVSARYNYQRRLDYTRYLSNFSADYEWNQGRGIKHEFSPIDLSFSFITKGSKILEGLNDLSASQRYRFENHIISGLKYRFIYNNQFKKSVENPIYLLTRVNLIGPTSILFNQLNLEKRDPQSNAITLGGIRYASFLRIDYDLRKYINLNNKQMIALRLFNGVGVPFDRSGVVPFDQLYFAGGANSIRGWQQRTLGPGGLFNPDNNVDRLGEIRIEFSTEYRFSITEIVKPALFVDAGNIWNIDDEVTESNFNRNNFYKQIAVAVGVGLRLDFDFFLFRLDIGFPVKQPYEYYHWEFYYKDPNFNLGIGYPF